MSRLPDDRDTVTRSLSPERFARVRALFEAALDRPTRERRAYLEGACGSDKALLEMVEGMLIAEGKGGAILDGPASNPPSSAPEEGRFPAGTVLAGRYRILGMLGRGGMGEVYKAFDLILNQIVALKFLNPAHLSEAALARFRNEVRIARQVSHPNVCRVYDLGMVEGLHFLSMEYIDGEDLASLLRRIGRLPQDKAMEFTRKICAGLGAAHERGVLHRDLKPANIMIDGRGQPRITDFGLAGLAAEIPLSDLRSGTPAYMSPEQKAGREVTTKSDLYSLGLVLYEMFTGKQRKDTQSTPSEIVKDLDPAIERVILRCLEDDPKRRPSTSLSIAMGLPGADPIAAALAAGETPSPEMVAASQEKEGFSARTAVLCLAAIVACMVAGVAFATRFGVTAQLPLPKPPEVLSERAREILMRQGYTDEPVDTAAGFACCDWGQQPTGGDRKQRLERLQTHRPAIVHYYYRQSQRPLGDGDGPFFQATEALPPNHEQGMAKVDVDPLGRLLLLEVMPWWTEERDQPVDWAALFAEAGLDMTRFQPITSEGVPPMAIDQQWAWKGTYSDDRSDDAVVVRAASWRGRPVWFQTQKVEPTTGLVLTPFFFVFGGVLFLCTGILAIRHWWQGRLDVRGVLVVFFGIAVGVLLTGATIPPGSPLAAAGAYGGVEPYLRRYWPDSLISWNRVLRGHFRNPLVASHVLAGLAAGAAFGYLWFPALELLGPSWTTSVNLTLRGRSALGDFVYTLVESPIVALEFLAVFVLLRLLIRKLGLADMIAAVVFSLREGLSGAYFGGTWAVTTQAALLMLPSLTWIAFMRRFGLLGVMVLFSFGRAISSSPRVATGWMAERTLWVQGIPLAIALWCVWVILSSQPKTEDTRS